MAEDEFVLETEALDRRKSSPLEKPKKLHVPELIKSKSKKNLVEVEPEFAFLQVEKQAEPCLNYRVDTAALNFGTCKCGHPKAAHNNRKSNKAADMLSKLKAKNSTLEDDDGDYDIGSGEGPCNKFRVDTTANGFGICKCGHKRADHGAQESNKAEQALNKIKEANKNKYKGGTTDGAGACSNYRVDTNALEFGSCLCGYKKADHLAKEENFASKLVKNLKENNKEANELNDKLSKEKLEVQEIPQETVPVVAELNVQEQTAEKNEKVEKEKKSKPCVIC